MTGLTATTVAFLFTWRQQAMVMQLAFDKTAYNHVEAIQEAVHDKVLILQSVRAFFDVSGEVAPASFRDFVKPFLSQPHGFQALEWIPCVPHDRRNAFEQAARASGAANFEIRVRERQGHMVPSPPRAEYFPVYYVEPQAGNEAAVGFDLGSAPDRLKAIEKARRGDEPVATGGITLVQEKAGQTGILLFMPVYATGAAGKTRVLRGFVLGVFRVGDMIEAALSRLHDSATQVAILDPDDPRRPLYIHSDLSASRPGRGGREGGPQDAGVVPREVQINVGGRTWGILCTAAETFTAGTAWVPWAVLAAGIMLSLLTSVYISRLFGESLRMEQAIDAATGELSRSEARYRAIVEDQTDLVCRFGLDCVLTFVNPAYARFWGKTPQEMLGVDWRTLVPEAVRPSVGKHLADLTPENSIATMEHEVFDSHGQIRWQSWTDRAIFDGDGGIREFQSVGRDITERRQAELQVLREKALLRCLIDSIPDVIFFKDTHGVYLGCNPAFARYSGRTESQLIGLTDWDLFPPDIAESYVAHDRAMLSTGSPRQNEEWIEFPDGSRMLLDTLKTPYRGPEGQMLGLIGISRDITRAREAEQAVVDVHRRLLNAREEERRRIAEELHESICQDMAAVQMFLQPLSGDETAVPAEGNRSRLASAARICKSVLEKARGICYDL